MPNGTAVRLPPQLEPSSPGASSIEFAIGTATANAVFASCRALRDFEAFGAMTPAVREENGTRIARLFMLRQETGIDEFAFAAMVRTEGKRVVHARHDAVFRAEHGTDFPESLLDILIDDLLEILTKVAAAERRLAH
jgi:hypothetical protein